MKNIKILLTLLAVMMVGLTSCDEDYAQPPVVLPPGGIGTGTWNNPMTAYQASLGSVNDSLSTVWVKGYIVGWIDVDITNTLKAETAKFTVPATVNTNILIAPTPDTKDWSETIPVQLPSGAVRNALNLVNNPDVLGMLVCLQGETGSKYCGSYGVRSVSRYNFGETGIEGSDQPTTPGTDPTKPTGTSIYTALDPKSDALTEGWSYDNVSLGSGLSYVWSWKEYNSAHYLNASAYYNGTAIASEAYAVSPVIDLSGYTKVEAAFEHAAKFQTTLKELCGFVVREQGQTQWTKIEIPNWPGTSGWTFVSSGALDLSAFAGKKVQVGFKYGSSTAGADTWEIRSLEITGTK